MPTRSDRLRNNTYRLLRTQAESLRREGLSYTEIQEKVLVSKSTLSGWCKDIPLTEEQLKRLGSKYDTLFRGAKANQKKALENRKQIRENARSEIKSVNQEMLKIAGAMLYWAEGNKSHSTALSNSDPALIIFYISWLTKILNIKPTQLSAGIHLHEGQDDQEEKLFWSKLTSIPLDNFYKTFYKPIGTGHRKNILYHGTIKIRVKGVGSEHLKQKIMGWAEGFLSHYISNDSIEKYFCSRMDR